MKVPDPFLDLLGVGHLVFTHLEGKMTTVDEFYLFCPCSMSVFVSLAPSTRSSNSSFKLITIPSKLLTSLLLLYLWLHKTSLMFLLKRVMLLCPWVEGQGPRAGWSRCLEPAGERGFRNPL